MSPKPVYLELKKRIKGEWWTGPLKMKTDAQGRAIFRGFLGDYRLETNGRVVEFRLERTGKAEIELQAGKEG